MRPAVAALARDCYAQCVANQTTRHMQVALPLSTGAASSSCPSASPVITGASMVRATVIDRPSVHSATLRKFRSPSITLYFETAAHREVRDLRVFGSGSARLCVTTLADFNAEKGRWDTEVSNVYIDIDSPRDAKRLAIEMLQLIEASSLKRYEGSTAVVENFYLQ